MRPIAVWLMAAGCAQMADQASPPAEMEAKSKEEDFRDAGGGAASPAPSAVAQTERAGLDGLMDLEEGRVGKKENRLAGKPDDGEASPDETTLRRWFPEAFLWQPLVETDANGHATVDVRVPDSLTTWRVLGLAHDRAGRQAGTVATFDTRLPAWVEPVTPAFLYAGDEVVVPVQVFNGGADALRETLRVDATGVWRGGGQLAVTVPVGSSDRRDVRLVTTGAGPARLVATLGGADAVERVIPVRPVGRPVVTSRGGTLATTRSFPIQSADGADPRTESLEVLVFSGPLSVLAAELEALPTGPSICERGYGLALAGRLAALVRATGATLDPKASRRALQVGWQRVSPYAVNPDPATATDLLLVTRGISDHELASAAAARLTREVADAQRADGTWARQDTAPLQQVLVQTALAVRALPNDAELARSRARGAFERHLRRVEDPYTASAILATGLLDKDSASVLEKLLIDAIVERDGARVLTVPDGVKNAWGWTPSRAEALAWATLALQPRADLTWRGDLVGELLQGYAPGAGFGAGAADVLVLDALLGALPPAPRPVEVSLLLDGQIVARGTVDPGQPKLPVRLMAQPGAGAHTITLQTASEVPGLGFAATLRDWVPWTGSEALPGVDVEVDVGPMRLGREGTVTVTLAAPSGVGVDVVVPLPAGAQVDAASVRDPAGAVTATVRPDAVLLHARPFGAGEIVSVTIPVQPAFAGRFATAPVQVSADRGAGVALAPPAWTVAP